MRNGELEQYYWRLKRDADAFLKYGGDQGGGGHGAGSLLFEEIRRVVGSYARRQQLDAERFDDLFVYYAKFLLGEKPHISTVFQLADDLAGVRRGLRVQFGRFLTRHIHASAIGRLTDNLVDGLEMRFFGFGLTRHGSKSGVYWSESERGPDEQAQIRGALGDVESRLGEALRLALRDLRPLTNERRLASGYGTPAGIAWRACSGRISASRLPAWAASHSSRSASWNKSFACSSGRSFRSWFPYGWFRRLMRTKMAMCSKNKNSRGWNAPSWRMPWGRWRVCLR